MVALDRKLKDLEKRIAEAVDATGTTLTDIKGVGADHRGDDPRRGRRRRRFPSRHHFATYTGTAPLRRLLRRRVRHRLSRAGNRQLNHALHIIAMAHKRYDPRGADYYARKLAAGKGNKGALRCLKRRLSDVVFRRLVDDQTAKGPGRALGGDLNPARLT